jgi:hypothetical protein
MLMSLGLAGQGRGTSQSERFELEAMIAALLGCSSVEGGALADAGAFVRGTESRGGAAPACSAILAPASPAPLDGFGA